MKVEEGRRAAEGNRPSADPGVVLRAYYARKRLIAMRSSLFLAPCAILMALRAPSLGGILALGGACGIVNILAIMHNNERLLVGGRRPAVHIVSNMARLLVFGAIPVVAAIHEPVWALGIYLAGFFTPLALYAIELQRHFNGDSRARKNR